MALRGLSPQTARAEANMEVWLVEGCGMNGATDPASERNAQGDGL